MTDQARINADFAYRLRNINVETPSACITLRRTSTVALTAGVPYNISWQASPRSFGIDWSLSDPTNITILTRGYYYWFISLGISVASHTVQFELRNSGARWMMQSSALSILVATNSAYMFNFSGMAYLNAGNTLSAYFVDNTANSTLQVGAENQQGASPVLHVMQMSSEIF